MMKLTAVQQEALEFLQSDYDRHSSYGTRFFRQTYRALVARGLAESKGAGGLGSMFSPQTAIKFRALFGPKPRESFGSWRDRVITARMALEARHSGASQRITSDQWREYEGLARQNIDRAALASNTENTK